MGRMHAVTLAALLSTACPSDPPPACTDLVDTTCAPLYVPTFDNVYKNTLSKGCGSDRASCHSNSGKAGNLSFGDIETSFTSLVDNVRVKPGDPSCSELVVRLTGHGEDYQMPPGDALSDAETCAVIQWVQQGAQR